MSASPPLSEQRITLSASVMCADFRRLGEQFRELDKAGVPYVSTHAMRPSNDPTNLLADNHFTAEANRDFAREALKVIEAERGKTRAGR